MLVQRKCGQTRECENFRSTQDMCISTTVGSEDIKWSEHTEKVLLHMHKLCGLTRRKTMLGAQRNSSPTYAEQQKKHV